MLAGTINDVTVRGNTGHLLGQEVCCHIDGTCRAPLIMRGRLRLCLRNVTTR